MTLLVRALLFVSGAVAALFVARDAPNFGVLQMIAAVIFCAAIVAIVAFWPRENANASKPLDPEQ